MRKREFAVGLALGALAASALLATRKRVGATTGEPRPERALSGTEIDASRDGCREEVILAARKIHSLGRADFSPAEIISAMRAAGSFYADSTIRTHVASRMCANAPNNHGTTYDDLERVGPGRYRLRPQ